MKIAITTMEDNINSTISPDLLHANYLLIINTDVKDQYQFIPNMYNRSISGAEIFCSQFLIRKEIEIFICGKYDIQARDLLALAGIETIEMPNANISKVINKYKNEIINKKEASNEYSF